MSQPSTTNAELVGVTLSPEAIQHSSIKIATKDIDGVKYVSWDDMKRYADWLVFLHCKEHIHEYPLDKP